MVNTPFDNVVTTTTSVSAEPAEARVVVYLVHSGQSVEGDVVAPSGKREVEVVNAPFGLVVTTTTPESVSTEPSGFEVTKVVVYFVHSSQADADADVSGKRDVDVVKTPFGLVVTTTTPESV